MPGNTTRRYPPELRERGCGWSLRSAKITSRSGRRWPRSPSCWRLGHRRRCARGCAGPRSTPVGGRVFTTEETAELKRLKRENAELKGANAILRSASAFFAAELDRPPR
jgi:transposase